LAALMAADGVGAREWLEMRRRSRWGRPDGCQRLGCKGMALSIEKPLIKEYTLNFKKTFKF